MSLHLAPVGAAAAVDEHAVAVDEFLRVLVDGHRDVAAGRAGRLSAGSHDERAAPFGEAVAPEDGRLAAAAAALRATALREGALQARRLRQVARLADLAEAAARRELARGPRLPGQPDHGRLLEAAVTGGLQATLGVSAGQAAAPLELARRLTRVLPATLTALADGRLDLPRARALAQATTGCPDPTARRVQALLLPAAGQRPWDAPSPRAWRARLERAVLGADPDAARRRHQQALAERALRTWPDRDGTGVLWLRAGLADIALAEQAVTGLAHAWPEVDEQGRPLSMDQRRVDATLDLLRRGHQGHDLPHDQAGDPPHDQAGDPPRDQAGRRAGRGRQIGIVLHADTLLGDGPAAHAPGQLRGLGAPAPLDPHTARQTARTQLQRGAATRLLLTDPHGTLTRVLRLPTPPATGWTRASLTAALRAALADPAALPPLTTHTHTPTAAITEHVRARNPHCTSYDCPRTAQHADLDHNDPWPRGPTHPANLHPRCRRHHQLKTRRPVTTTLQPDGTVHTRMLTGLTITTHPDPLPGHGPGEAYEPR